MRGIPSNRKSLGLVVVKMEVGSLKIVGIFWLKVPNDKLLIKKLNSPAGKDSAFSNVPWTLR